MLLNRILEREQFIAVEASDGFEAIRIAQNQPIDLILIDIQMPGMDGFETVRRLRDDQRTERIPIIIVTAVARDAGDVARGFGLGADDYIVKPFNSSELMARVRAKIKARQLEDTLQRRNEELATLIRIGHQMNRALALPDLAENLLDALCDHLKVKLGGLLIYAPTGTILYATARGAPRKRIMDSALANLAVRQGRSIMIRDMEAEQDISPTDFSPEIVCRSALVVPICHQMQTLGVICLGYAEPDRFNTHDVHLLQSVAEQAALAIRNAQLYAELSDYAQNLEDMVKARTDALQKAQELLTRADKLAAIGTLAAGIAHEINNPLQALLYNLELALEDIDSSHTPERETLDMAREDVHRIRRIVSRLLDFARPTESGLTALSLNHVVQEVLSFMYKQLEHARVEAIQQLRATHLINGSADQLKQVILNLCVNALDAMPNGGQLRIATANIAESDSSSGVWVELIIEDTGIGIAPEHISQIFDPFFTTKANGTGLGLSISHSIIQGHGGQLWVESQPRRTRFTVRLPAAAPQT
ncbi:MAG: hypothetical protein OHK0023_27790 [Anaerolineae bacterium]